jgi:diketogulonate reductase-like aldo/keto reductase
MEELVDAGLARNIGVSNFSLAQLDRIREAARIKPVVNQVECHPLLAQRRLVGGALRKVGAQMQPAACGETPPGTHRCHA